MKFHRELRLVPRESGRKAPEEIRPFLVPVPDPLDVPDGEANASARNVSLRNDELPGEPRRRRLGLEQVPTGPSGQSSCDLTHYFLTWL